jgi:AcrR family transcriptional regulator
MLWYLFTALDCWHTQAMPAIRTARARARAELTQEIKAAARRQLTEHGAQQLSLRAVAKELGMVSSALYRYFPSRDHLLTELIIDAYDSLGAAAEAADARVEPADHHGRWRAVCHEVRRWARAHPHEYALIYGTPVPGYQAPADTVAPATRVVALLIGHVRASFAAGTLALPDDGPPLSPALVEQAELLAANVAPELPAVVLVRIVFAWTQLAGMISFELFGQLVGSMDPADPFAEYAAAQLADYVGLRPAHLQPLGQAQHRSID